MDAQGNRGAVVNMWVLRFPTVPSQKCLKASLAVKWHTFTERNDKWEYATRAGVKQTAYISVFLNLTHILRAHYNAANIN